MEDLLDRNRKAPRPAFARELQSKLNQQENTMSIKNRLKVPVAGLAAVLGLTTALQVPAVNALAQDFLNLFRVRRVTAIAIDPQALSTRRDPVTREQRNQINDALRSNMTVVKEAGELQAAPDAAAASTLAGIPVRLPAQATLMEGLRVRGESEARFTTDVNKIRAALQALDMEDVQIPDLAEGAPINIKTPAVVTAKLNANGATVELIQARSPEVQLPPGVRMADLGVISLRAMGMDKANAEATAAKIDWNSTFVMPIPANAASFRDVTIAGREGILIESRNDPAGEQAQNGRRRGRPQGVMVIWTDGDIVYALQGNISDITAIQLAESVMAN
jgi:hypothetical protein